MADTPLCYFPNGALATRDTPCKSPSLNGGASACCAYSDICLDNHLCLGQDGAEVITRGSCTDQKWQSPEFKEDNGAVIHPVYVQNQYKFCCVYGDQPANNTCFVPTKGSTDPFSVTAGLVIYNRTSGSTTPINQTNTETIINTITATATVTASASTSTLALAPASSTSSPPPVRVSSSSKTGTAIAASMSGLLGLLFLLATGLLWRQRTHLRSLRKENQTWSQKYSALTKAQTAEAGGLEHHPSTQTASWDSNGWGDRPHLRPQGWGPDEVEGAQIHEMANQSGRA